jgi:DNA repair protein RecN (Recombination protein N)
MLTSLSIKNFALIEELAIDFSNGFSIITGETGAGKSILLGALGLVLGKRADLTSLKNKEQKCIIEANFNLSDYDLESFFEEHDLDFEPHTIIRREILPSGKSRAFINDSPVNLPEILELSTYLIDIHSQNQTQELSEETMQFKILDTIGDNQQTLLAFENDLKTFKKLKTELNLLQTNLINANKEKDYNTFLLNELCLAKLVLGEQESLEATFEQLNNVEFIKENLDKALAISDTEQFGVLQNLKDIKFALQKISNFAPTYQQLLERTNSVIIEFDDIVSDINNLTNNLLNDPVELDLVNSKLQTIYNLQKKHQVQTIDELIAIQNELENKVIASDSLELQIKNIGDEILQLEKQLNEKAIVISNNRIAAIPILTDKLLVILEQLGMPNARFDIQLQPSETFYSNGKDTLQFLFSANKGSSFGLLKKVASGGEMSRIMLATKAILANYSNLPTIIFDEIDTGVSGEIANKMAAIMKQMSAKMQVFAITHLPQIAGKGSAHFKVYKTVIDGQTQTQLKLLTFDERVTEIAEMLSGSDISESAVVHAKALLN